MRYIELVSLDFGVGLLMYVLAETWYRYLKRLAVSLNVEERRKQAATWYVVIGPSALVSVMGSWLGGIMLLKPKPGPEVLIPTLGVLIAVLPAIIRYLSRWKELSKLGYGRQG